MKYWQLTKNWIARHLTYRARVLIWFIFDGIHFIAFPFIWLVVYGEQLILNGFSRADIVTYYVIVAIISTLATCHINRLVRMDIINGDLSCILLQPISYILYRCFQDLSYHLVFVPFTIILCTILAVFFPVYVHLPQTFFSFSLFVVALFLSYLISSCFAVLLGLTAFWLGETTGLEQIKYVVETVFSGQIAPLVFFPHLLQKVAAVLPFRFLADFPAQVYLSQLNHAALIQGFGLALAWFFGMGLLIWMLWKRGLRRYEGAGL